MNLWKICLTIFVVILQIGQFYWSQSTFGQERRLLIERQATWRYHAAKDAPPDVWQEPAFADDGWKQGRAGFGYADGDDRTVLDDMLNNYRSVYVRSTFDVPDPSQLESIYLYVKYDDGFIAYINGKQVVSARVKKQDGQLNVAEHEAEDYELFVIENAKVVLQVGKNVLAIEGHNRDLASSDFSLDPFLATEKVSTTSHRIQAEDMRADLAEFQRRLEDQSSYLTRRDYDYKKAISKLSESIDESTETWQFVFELRKIVMQLGDCHADVTSRYDLPDVGCLPIRPALTQHGIAVLALNRQAPLDDKYPYLDSIDGLPLEKWLEVAGAFVQQGSSQLIQYRSLQWLPHIELLRSELKLPSSRTANLKLRSADGTQHSEQTVRLTRQNKSSTGKIRYGSSHTLDGNIDYVRIPQMDKRLVSSVVKGIVDARDSNGLILDVRDNSGGTYDLMHAVYGFFVPEQAKPYVTNIAAYRLSHEFTRDHLFYRPTYPLEWTGWNDAEKLAIIEATKVFRPEWEPPSGTMSAWHYMVLSRDRGQQAYYHYDKPVIVLCNPGSFSATDGFLSAFADLPQVTLMGQPSGGGSGATRRFILPKTQTTIALSSMASYRANGKTYDGHGVEVDVEVMPVLDDFFAESDSVLLQAHQRLSNH